ncbi:MAG: hypothetical protein ABWY57_15990 [Mycetocola sp.]
MADLTLASSSDVAAQLGRALTSEETARVDALLEKASGLFRKRSGQTFTPGQSLVRLKVNGGLVRLPESPVVDVISVTDDDSTPIEYTLFGQTITLCRRSDRFVRVDYKHGSDTVPDLVRVTVAEVVARVLRIAPGAMTGLSQFQKTDGPFSRGGTYAPWAVGGQLMLSPDDISTALLFRAPHSGNLIVQTP